ncbi:MAG: hypothetical protein ACKOAD_04790 [Gammaproteobacteria bacterium]
MNKMMACHLIDFGNHPVLLPNTVIAEVLQIVDFQSLKASELSWRAKNIPWYNEYLLFNTGLLTEQKAKKWYLAVLNNVISQPKHDFVGLVFHSLPSLVRIFPEALKDTEHHSALNSKYIEQTVIYKEKICYILNLGLLFQ